MTGVVSRAEKMNTYDYTYDTSMLRSYESLSPTSSKMLQMRWDQTGYHKHRHAVKVARPIVDSRPPATYSHLHLKLKKLQAEEERMAVVERDNRILLEKMSKIMRTHGQVECRNDYEYKSSNLAKRRDEMLRVTRENQGVLKRLMRTKPQYSSQAMLQEWTETLTYMDKLSRFPRNWWNKTPRSTPTKKNTPLPKSEEVKMEKAKTPAGDRSEDDQEQDEN